MAKRIYRRLYCGYKRDSHGSLALTVFRSDVKPTVATHGDLYAAVIGPFCTRAGASWMSDPIRGRMNPHCRCVADAERLAVKYASEYNPKTRAFTKQAA